VLELASKAAGFASPPTQTTSIIGVTLASGSIEHLSRLVSFIDYLLDFAKEREMCRSANSSHGIEGVEKTMLDGEVILEKTVIPTMFNILSLAENVAQTQLTHTTPISAQSQEVTVTGTTLPTAILPEQVGQVGMPNANSRKIRVENKTAGSILEDFRIVYEQTVAALAAIKQERTQAELHRTEKLNAAQVAVEDLLFTALKNL